MRLDLLQPLHIVHTRNLAHAVDDSLQVLEVGDFQYNVDTGLTVAGAGLDVPDIGALVGDDGRDLLQHAETIVAEKRELDGIGNRLTLFVTARPLHVDAAVGFIEKIGDVGAVNGVNRYTLAAGHVADDRFSANGVATLGAVDQQVAMALHDNGVVIAAKNAAYHAGEATRGLLLALRQPFATGRRQLGQHLAG